MEKKYQDAMFTGLNCGSVIALIILICNIVTVLLSSTPAMIPYTMNNLAISHPGPLPIEYHILSILAIVELATLVIGYLVTGVYVIRSGEQRKNTVNYIVTIGAIAGIMAEIPVFVTSIIYDIILAAFRFPLSPLTPGNPYTPGLTGIGLVLSAGGCLAEGIIISAILSAVGAWGYAYFTKGIKSAF